LLLLVLLLVRSASVSLSDVRHFSSISAIVRAFLLLDVVCCTTYTGIRTFIIVALQGMETSSITSMQYRVFIMCSLLESEHLL
jgi:hypothetical protein